jgi:hypothetical protein
MDLQTQTQVVIFSSQNFQLKPRNLASAVLLDGRSLDASHRGHPDNSIRQSTDERGMNGPDHGSRGDGGAVDRSNQVRKYSNKLIHIR